jgi:oxygen-independent coproporphyrinogen-3 oxidase
MLPQGHVQNTPRTVAYRDAIAAGRLATCRGVELSSEDRVRRTAIERLMCDLAVDIAAVAEQHDPAVLEPDPGRLDTLGRFGLLHRDRSRIIVSEAGRPFVRNVCALFDAYLMDGDVISQRTVRYSRSV